MARIQTHRQVSIETPLGADALLLWRMRAVEEMGRPFTIELDLFSENDGIKFSDIIGQSVTVSIPKGDGDKRHFNGFVSRFAQTGKRGRLTQYTATAVPWLWFLTRTADCKIFQNKDVPAIIEKVFRDFGFTDFDNALSGTYHPREFCVQYRETAFNFVSRLMEEEGIYYFFQHADGSHKLVMADSRSAHNPCEGYKSIVYRPPEQSLTVENVHEWIVEQRLQSGKYAHKDFNFEKPKTDLTATSKVSREYAQADFEVYDYPGEYPERSDGDAYAKVRIQEIQAHYETFHGRSNCRGVCAGYTFELAEHPKQDLCKEYLIVSTDYTVESDEFDPQGQPTGRGPTYDCAVTAMDVGEPFRPQRLTPRPMIRGPQTAIVAGKSGEEIWTDKYGRVAVQFHWDRYGKSDENSSCWVRVAQVWAGKNWGAMHIPRIGQEVIVEFLEGDPDRPIITGRVYNADEMPPYSLPGNKTQSGLKSRSSKGGGEANFNEIRMEDKKGSEQLYIHAEKNEDIVVENDKTENIGHDETISIGNDRTETVSGNEILTVVKDRTRTVQKNETVTVALMRVHTVGINEAITIGAAQEVTIGAAQTITVGAVQATTVGASQTNTIGADQSTEVGANQSNQVGANRNAAIGSNDSLVVVKKLSIEAGDEISIRTGDASINLKKDGTITIKGKDIIIEGSGAINVKASKNVVVKGQKILQN